MQGGARAGAGRPKGSPDKKKRPPRPPKEKALPAHILLDIAQYHHQRALGLRALQNGKALVATIDLQGEIRQEHAMAGAAADKAAGFYHPKLATLQSSRPPDATQTTLEQMLLALDAIEPANSNALLLEGTVDKVDAAE